MQLGSIVFNPKSEPSVVINPASESRRMVRKRTIAISGPPSPSMSAKLAIILDNLHSSKFTGELIINFGQGSVRNAVAMDSDVVEPR